ncbi:hypothetical protein GCM10010360_67780 [Streptomyces nogalater]
MVTVAGAVVAERAGAAVVPSAACTAGAVCTARAASAATETAVTELRRAQGRLVIAGVLSRPDARPYAS